MRTDSLRVSYREGLFAGEPCKRGGKEGRRSGRAGSALRGQKLPRKDTYREWKNNGEVKGRNHDCLTVGWVGVQAQDPPSLLILLLLQSCFEVQPHFPLLSYFDAGQSQDGDEEIPVIEVDDIVHAAEDLAADKQKGKVRAVC